MIFKFVLLLVVVIGFIFVGKQEKITKEVLIDSGHFGTKYNFDTALKIVRDRKSSKEDKSEAYYELGSICERYADKLHRENQDRAKIEKYYDIAFKSYLNSAELENFKAYSNLAKMYHYGKGTKKDIQKASLYYEKACRAYSSNPFLIADCYEWGKIKGFHNPMTFLKEKCTNKDAEACFMIGALQQTYSLDNKNSSYYWIPYKELGLDVMSQENALFYFKKACELEYQEGCSEAKSLKDSLKSKKP
ncbi:tetratricopeptide repeat protein [Helicobacter cetorum]|uniref:tetratricopeptide repeat protein n=1 Tax=Helicobacter cetorum TaxID=138563 RepID=UPI000CF09B2A|nr:tetratricopeptide repeat protein [Helicobacter cetorum]